MGEPYGLQAGLRPYIYKGRVSPAKALYFNDSGISVFKNESKGSYCTPSAGRSPGINHIHRKGSGAILILLAN
jgi:hypothetical protein